MKKALEYGLTPIICVGETLEEKEAGKTIEIITSQIEKGLVDLKLGCSANKLQIGRAHV